MGEPVNEIPEGFKISESVNGIVSLVKDRPSQLLPEETAAVETTVGRHPKAHNYRVSTRHDRIEVYERVGPDPDELIAELRQVGLLVPGQMDRLRAQQERRAQFTPVLRFILADAEQRTFYAERWCYLGSVDDWIQVGSRGSLERLAHQLIPRLGSERFFEVY